MDAIGKNAPGITLAIILAAGGCASQPPAPGPQARQVIEIMSHKGGTSLLHPRGFTPGIVGANDPTIEAVCSASNDRGSWTITAPGRLEVSPSLAPLKITCRSAGYRDTSVELKCVTPRNRSAAGGGWGALQVFAMAGPYGLVAAPAIGAVLVVTAGAAAVGGGAGAALASGPEADVCTYVEGSTLHVWMLPAG